MFWIMACLEPKAINHKYTREKSTRCDTTGNIIYSCMQTHVIIFISVSISDLRVLNLTLVVYWDKCNL